MRLAFYKGRRSGFAGLFDTAVRWWTRGPYSHVELVFPDGIAASSSNRDGGVRFKRIDFAADRWDFVEIGGDEAAAEAWFDAHYGAGYDYLGLFGFVWRPEAGDNRRWFCSEAIAAALGYRDPWRFCPNTLAVVTGRAVVP
ncbi:MAG: hypothetical protein C0486_09955 [Erythrobacter sp.]|nr:hypothetical protein [Erythrobacter sp.]MBA4081472.1 hypothetical protein [Erythrobacter sp.]